MTRPTCADGWQAGVGSGREAGLVPEVLGYWPSRWRRWTRCQTTARGEGEGGRFPERKFRNDTRWGVRISLSPSVCETPCSPQATHYMKSVADSMYRLLKSRARVRWDNV